MMEGAETVEGPLIGTLLRIPSSVVAEATERGLAAAGYEEVRAAHLPVLQPLFTRPEGARITDLAAWTHVTKPAMVYLVNHLEAHGYVERTADPVDGRAQRVRITERGAAAIHCVRTLVQQTEADWAARIGVTQLAELKRILRSLIASFEEHGEATSKD
jgi:DNA-binding MarR family transcriptional regulator